CMGRLYRHALLHCALSHRMPPEMRWLLYGEMTGAVGEALVRHGHQTHTIADLQLTVDSTPEEILKAAQAKQLDILTTDDALAMAPFELKYWFNRSIVYLQLEGGDVEQ